MTIARQIAWLPLFAALTATTFAQGDGASNAEIAVTGLTLLRPAAADAMRPARTQMSIRIAMPTEDVIGLGRDSRITRLEDDTGHSLLVEHGPAEQDQTEPFGAPPGLTWRDPSPPGAAFGFLRRDDFGVGGRDGWIEITVDAPELPAQDATQLTVAGTIDVLVAGEGETRHRIDNIDLSDGEERFEIGEETITCTEDRSLTQGDLHVSEFYCWSMSLQPRSIAVVGQDEAPPPPMNRANLVAIGETQNLSLEVTFPISETRRINFEERVGFGL